MREIQSPVDRDVFSLLTKITTNPRPCEAECPMCKKKIQVLYTFRASGFFFLRINISSFILVKLFSTYLLTNITIATQKLP
jgi:hypothetical protein